MKILKKLAGQTVIYGLSSVVGRLLNYLLVPFLTRPDLGGFFPAQYGVITEMYAYIAFLIVILTYGFETAFFRFSNKEGDLNGVYSTALISLLISSVIFASGAYIFSDSISAFIGYVNNPEYVQILSLVVALDALTSISFAKLRLQNRAARFALVKLIGIFVNIGLVLFFILYCPYAIKNDLQSSSFVSTIYNSDIGIGYVFIANLVSSIITAIMLIPEMFNVVYRFNKRLWKEMFKYSFPLIIAGLAGMINETLDRVLIKHVSHPVEVYQNHFLQKVWNEKIPEESAEYITIKDEVFDSDFKDTNTNLSLETKRFIMIVRQSELGLYGGFYKLAILMILFIQTFRFAAEPFFFSHEKEKGSRKTYAVVMKYFLIVMCFIFLLVTSFYDIIVMFLGEQYRDTRGFFVVSILLLANLFLGIYYNLAVWYKLSEKTNYGAYLSLIGAIITLSLNLILIPIFGFEGSAFATLACYVSITIISYYFSKKYYEIPYEKNRLMLYLTTSLALFFAIYLLSPYSVIFKFIGIVLFFILVYALERPKKTVISNPKLFN